MSESSVESCPFCDVAETSCSYVGDLVIALRDRFPVTPGHTLVITRRCVPTYFDATPWEQHAIWQAVDAVKRALDAEFKPAGYNVGFNAGSAAGQTVPHLHVHMIPRYRGDVRDPRGGVRGVIPSKQNYLRRDATNIATSAEVEAVGPAPFRDLPRFVPGQEQEFLPVLNRALRQADEACLLSAFVQLSGLRVIEGALQDALDRGARVRVLTGDYLCITDPLALQRLCALASRYPELEARLYRSEQRSFHPKAYLFRGRGHAVAYVGSSNLSGVALTTGVEWNLRTGASAGEELEALFRRFDALFASAAPMTSALVDEYSTRARARLKAVASAASAPDSPHEDVAARSLTPEPPPAPARPRPIQQEVLTKLVEVRREGASRGLVVMATGLGKTFLSAFDFAQLEGRRALFVAHRQEILSQAMETWQRVLPDRSAGLLVGDRQEPDAELVFASVQTLSRVRHLRAFAPEHFDYLVIDEFHHAAAASYRKLLGHFRPRFMLGLTATPERTDGAQLLELCHDVLVARVGLVEGVARGELVPFRYYGVKDELDYRAIPWRSGRFDSEALTRASATEARAAQALREYRLRAPTDRRRALVFCCSREHADFVASYFTREGVAAAAVHSGPSSAHRAESVERLREGSLEAIVAVDIFNEGVDLPDVNTILMLRPTESPIVFVQQLGRGLRRADGKPFVVVIDFIGNHRSFLVKPQALLSLTGHSVAPGDALRRITSGSLELPEGCSVEIETEAIELLERVAKFSSTDELLFRYTQIRDAVGRRPTPSELLRANVSLAPIKQRFGTWFDFAEAMEDLGEDEARVLRAHHGWFRDLMKTQMRRSYKMIALQALDDADALHDSIAVDELASRCRARLQEDPVLRNELREYEAGAGTPEEFVRRWRKAPLEVIHRAKGFSRQWFALEGERFVSRLAVAERDREVFDLMTQELVALRLGDFCSRRCFAADIVPFATPIELGVSHASKKPILRFDRGRRPDVPTGEVRVVVDDEPYLFRFVKIAVNVVTRLDGGVNVLPELMRRWFGPTAGLPGTRHRVRLESLPGGRWRLRRSYPEEGGVVIPLGALPFYEDLRVACGGPNGQVAGQDKRVSLPVETSLPVDPKRHFIVRAEGSSMDGGPRPIRDGELVLCEWLSATRAEEVVGHPTLLTGEAGGESWTAIKIPARRDGRWLLRSANPRFEDKTLDPETTLRPVARVLEVVTERSGLALWGQYDRDSIAAAFGETVNPSWSTGHRDVQVGGAPHSILMVNLRKGKGTKVEHLYADQFLSPREFQWESQASTTVASAKGRRILNHVEDGRAIHLFVRFHAKDAKGRGEPFTYCGAVTLTRYEGEQPIRVWFELEVPLPHALWSVWSR